jgi:L-ascorbate metabolism protein UlaG (beta-lactamase superfamily)
MGDSNSGNSVAVHYLGGPTAILEMGGLRLLTDPTFDPPGEYPVGQRKLVKTTGPATAPDALGTIDAVLLSHDQHPDNLDNSGRDFLRRVDPVLSTVSAQQRLGGTVTSLPNWGSVELPRPDGSTVTITGVPAQHGPDGTEHLVGEVTGFVLCGKGIPLTYVSGDNASLPVVRSIAERFGSFDLALLFAGAARTPLVPDGVLTLRSQDAAEAVKTLDARQVVPLHFEHWGHFTEGEDALLDAFDKAGIANRLRLLTAGNAARF